MVVHILHLQVRRYMHNEVVVLEPIVQFLYQMQQNLMEQRLEQLLLMQMEDLAVQRV